MMHRHKMSPAVGRNSVHMTPQSEHRKMSAPGGTPSSGRHHMSTSSRQHHQQQQYPVSATGTPHLSGDMSSAHRRRNSQPTRSSQGVSSSLGSMTRQGSGSSALAANQRVTEWLRSAGSVPEEVEDDVSPHRRSTDGQVFASPMMPHGPTTAVATSATPTTPHMRWNTTRAMFAQSQPPPPPMTHHFFPRGPATTPSHAAAGHARCGCHLRSASTTPDRQQRLR